MTRHKLRFSPEFDNNLEELSAAGRMTLLRATALEEALQDLQRDPMRHDGTMDGVESPHWMKLCRAAGGVDTGLRIIYLLGEEGTVHLDDLVLVDPNWLAP